MPRLPRLIVALAASSAGMLLAGTGHAATQALALLETGQICNSMPLIALQWLAGHHATLSEKWLRGA